MAWGYGTDGSSALKPEWDDDSNKIIPFPERPNQKDYSQPRDHSGYKDYSNSDSVRNEQSTKTKNSLADAENNAADSAKSEQSGKSPRDIAKGENSSWESRMENFANKQQQVKTKKEGSFFVRHKKGVAGGLIGLVMGGGMLGIGSMISGPAQFIQAMQFLSEAKMWVTGAQTGARMIANMASLSRWAVKADALGEKVQNSRLGIVGTKMAKNAIRELDASGVSFDRNFAGNARNLIIDTHKEFGGNIFDQEGNVNESITRRYGIDKDAIKSINPDGTINVDLDKMSYSKTRRFLNAARSIKWFNFVGKIQTRLTLKRVGKLSWLHPIEKLKQKAANKFADWVTDRMKRIENNGFGSPEKAAERARDNARDAAEREGLSDSDIDARGNAAYEKALERFTRWAAEGAETGVKSIAKDVIAKAGSKVTSFMARTGIPYVGIILAVLEITCLLESLDDGIGAEKYVQTVLPAQQSAAETMAVGSQIMSGDDIDLATVGNYTQLKMYNEEVQEVAPIVNEKLEQTGSETVGTITSNWWFAAPVRAELGEQYTDTSRAAVPAALDDVSNGNLSFGGNETAGYIFNGISEGIYNGLDSGIGGFPYMALSALYPELKNVGPMAIVCFAFDKIDEFVGALVDVVLNLPPIKALIDWFQTTAAAEAMATFFGYITGWLRGTPLDIATAYPESFGSIDMYGSLFLANEQMLANGGRILSEPEATALMTEQKQYLAELQSQKPWLERIFSPTDYTSTIAYLARTANFAPVNNFGAILGNSFKLFAATPTLFGSALNKIGGGNTSAYDPTPYEYGVPMVAYSTTEMDQLVSNDTDFEIATNAEKVYDMIDADQGLNILKNKIEGCFAVTIGGKESGYAVTQLNNEDGSAWNYVDSTQHDELLGVTVSKDISSKADCVTDGDMLHIRTYIMDYNLVMASACYEGDEADSDIKQACDYSGNSSSGGGNSSSSNSSLDFETLAAEFDTATGSSGDYDGASGQQCFDIPVWFMVEKTNLGFSKSAFNGKGNANVLASVAVEMSGGKLTLSSEPKSPGMFSAKSCGIFGATLYQGACYGHTGLVVDVKDNGDGSKTVTTMEGWDGANPVGQKFEHKWTAGMDVDFVGFGDVLK